jgi:hypothetical protein
MIPSAIDLYNLEKKAAGNATRSIRSGLKSAIAKTTFKQSGTALNQAGSRAVFKDNRLQRVTIKAPHYIFKQHHGFEGKKKNGIMMRLRSTGVINIALDETNVLETLADQISDIRASKVESAINFERNANAQYRTR